MYRSVRAFLSRSHKKITSILNSISIHLMRLINFYPSYLTKNASLGQDKRLVGITVSTGYAKVLSLLLDKNLQQLDAWIIVTSPQDKETIDTCRGHEKVHLIFWDFRNKGRKFDKGGGLRQAQKLAYSEFPKARYLILDSDILLPQDFSSVILNKVNLLADRIYGSRRVDYFTEEDFLLRMNPKPYEADNETHGYLQLYVTPVLYRSSMDASKCDLAFRDLFLTSELLPDLEVTHLGAPGNWTGSGENFSSSNLT